MKRCSGADIYVYIDIHVIRRAAVAQIHMWETISGVAPPIDPPSAHEKKKFFKKKAVKEKERALVFFLLVQKEEDTQFKEWGAFDCMPSLQSPVARPSNEKLAARRRQIGKRPKKKKVEPWLLLLLLFLLEIRIDRHQKKKKNAVSGPWKCRSPYSKHLGSDIT